MPPIEIPTRCTSEVQPICSKSSIVSWAIWVVLEIRWYWKVRHNLGKLRKLEGDSRVETVGRVYMIRIRAWLNKSSIWAARMRTSGLPDHPQPRLSNTRTEYSGMLPKYDDYSKGRDEFLLYLGDGKGQPRQGHQPGNPILGMSCPTPSRVRSSCYHCRGSHSRYWQAYARA